MTVPPSGNRRAVPRFKVWIACSVFPLVSDEQFREQAVLGHVKDLSRDAVAVSLPSNELCGVDDSGLGKQVQMNLALPVGYVKLSATLIRSAPEDSGKYLLVFAIQESKERRKYNQYLDSVESELLGTSKASLSSRLSIIETKLRPK
jgi:hypothetical protein